MRQAQEALEALVNRRPVIAVVCDVIYPYSHGGREFRNRELLPRLARRADIHVYTMHWWDGPSIFKENGITYHAISRLIPLYKDNRRSLWQALCFGLASLKLLWRDFDVLDADHIPYFQVFVLRIVSSLKRKPFIVTWHEAWSRAYWCHYLGMLGRIAWLTECVAMRLPDQIIAASPQTAERLRSSLRGRIPITTVPNGIDLSLIHNVRRPETDSIDLVTVGRLIDHKRVDLLLDAIALLHKRGIYATCRIIGDGPARTSLIEQAKALGIAHAIQFYTAIDNQEQLYALVKAARAFISLSAREGFGIAVLEAIACGIPVVTTSAPDNHAQYLVTSYSKGIVCEPELHTIADTVQRLLKDGGTYSHNQHDADDWIADYDWNAVKDRVADVYTRVSRTTVAPLALPSP